MTNRALALLALAALALAPMASAGDRANPEIADPGDDVAVNGGQNCGVTPGPCLAGMDFFWHNADMELVWVNDTADAILLTMELRASEGFGQDTEAAGSAGQADDFTYVYTFAFTLHGHEHQAVVTLDDALAVTVGGAATSAAIDGRDLTVNVAKAGMDPPAVAGDVLGGLHVTMHAEASQSGVTLDDRAPDANAGPDYVLSGGAQAGPDGNGTGSAPAKGSPSPALPFLALGVIAAALVLRRRE